LAEKKGNRSSLQASAIPATAKQDEQRAEAKENTHSTLFGKKSGVSIGICCEFVLRVV